MKEVDRRNELRYLKLDERERETGMSEGGGMKGVVIKMSLLNHGLSFERLDKFMNWDDW